MVETKGSSKVLIKKNLFSVGSEILCCRFDPEDTLLAAGNFFFFININKYIYIYLFINIVFNVNFSLNFKGLSNGGLKIFHLHSGNIKIDARVNDIKNSSPCTCLR